MSKRYDENGWGGVVKFEDPPKPKKCDHKFIDSIKCVECGWDPRYNPIAGFCRSCHCYVTLEHQCTHALHSFKKKKGHSK